jgi:2-C-methyl-D-erythritol 4-phosphate cytidylyltransferase
VDGVWGIVVAAGRGDRFGEAKQFCELAGTRVIDHALAPLVQVCDGIVVVLPPGFAWKGTGTPVDGGATRSDSVRAGLRAIPEDADIVVVHDAARPLATPALFDAVIAAVQAGADAAVPGIPVSDTLKRVEGERVLETVDRERLVAVQTPQAFRAFVLRAAHAQGGYTTDDAALVEAARGQVVIVPGDPRNLKITTPDDLLVAAALLDSP